MQIENRKINENNDIASNMINKVIWVPFESRLFVRAATRQFRLIKTKQKRNYARVCDCDDCAIDRVKFNYRIDFNLIASIGSPYTHPIVMQNPTVN